MCLEKALGYGEDKEGRCGEEREEGERLAGAGAQGWIAES